MLERVVNSRTFVSFLLAGLTGLILFSAYPFPQSNLYLQYIALKEPLVYSVLARSYTLFLFTTPFFIYSTALSGVYVLSYGRRRKQKTNSLPPYPDPSFREDLFLVIGEIHHPTKIAPGSNPQWLTIPEKGLFTGVGIFGAIGTGKTSCCMRPFAEQLIAYKADDPAKRIGGLVLEVKGDFCHQIREIAAQHGREDDYVEVALDSEYRYNPLHNDLDSSALAYSVASLLNNLYGRGKEPFWQQAYTNMLQHIILLHKVLYDYVTFFDVYECAISPPKLEKRIEEGKGRFETREYVCVTPEVYGNEKFASTFSEFGFVYDEQRELYKAPTSGRLDDLLGKQETALECQRITVEAPSDVDDIKRQQLEAVQRWYFDDWSNIDKKLQSSVVEGISVFLSLFDDNPPIKRLFCPPRELYEPNAVPIRGKRALPPIRELLESGKIVALDFPAGENPGLARAVAVMLKMDFQRAMINRIARMAAEPDKQWRPVLFVCDEYQQVATVTEHEPNGDDQFFSLSRQAKCIPIVATQSISSLQSMLPGESWRTLLQTFRTKIFLTQTDGFSAKIASELCGQENVWRVNYNISESGHDSKVSYLTGKPLADKAHISTSKTYSQQRDYRFDMKAFTELKNAQSITLAYDGVSPLPPMYCYLKPNHRDVNKNYFLQLHDKEL